ncbi:hypothetical protein [Amycolatopsis speibonae]|uniref:TetR family transcriptional regulator n=1 Tax=Amycolatopsis speibonae TaxID=1450224 RepID=A0ABV7NP32_9PSEU
MHEAVRDLMAEAGRDALTVLSVAARAGVAPSTNYRRQELLSDVAVERLRPEAFPEGHGCLTADLTAWVRDQARTPVVFALDGDEVAGVA